MFSLPSGGTRILVEQHQECHPSTTIWSMDRALVPWLHTHTTWATVTFLIIILTRRI